jgi:DNA (cytosine-5)-methyltransferase 1
MGYHLAGFEVVGVDIKPQPNYPFEFIQANVVDMLPVLGDLLGSILVVHASPPCQAYSRYRNFSPKMGTRRIGDGYPRLIEPVRAALERAGVLYVLENVPGAPLVDPVTLCGSSFGLDIRRHRLFETNWDLPRLACDHAWQTPRFPQSHNRVIPRCTVEVGVGKIPLAVQEKAMGIDWMSLVELSEAIPPAYTRYIGEHLLAHLAA